MFLIVDLADYFPSNQLSLQVMTSLGVVPTSTCVAGWLTGVLALNAPLSLSLSQSVSSSDRTAKERGRDELPTLIKWAAARSQTPNACSEYLVALYQILCSDNTIFDPINALMNPVNMSSEFCVLYQPSAPSPPVWATSARRPRRAQNPASTASFFFFFTNSIESLILLQLPTQRDSRLQSERVPSKFDESQVSPPPLGNLTCPFCLQNCYMATLARNKIERHI